MSENVFGNPVIYNKDATFYKDVYIFGRLYYEFESNPVEILRDVDVLGKANFFGPVVFNENVEFNDLTVKKRLDVGLGGTTFSANALLGNVGIGSTIPQQDLDVSGTVIISQNLGVGITNPTSNLQIVGNSSFDGISSFTTNIGNTDALQVLGNAYVSNNLGIGTTNPFSNLMVIGDFVVSGGNAIFENDADLYVLGTFFDKFSNAGELGQVLLTDGGSVFWGDVSGIGSPLQTIGVYDEGIFQGVVSNLNFIDGIDPNNLVSATATGPTANITISDRWSLVGSDIYRMSKVGIQNATPSSTLDVTGTVHATGAVDFDSTLNVDGGTTLKSTLSVDGATDLNTTLNVDGTTTLVGQVQVNTGIVPDSDEGAYLGSAALPFSDAHIGEIRIANSTNDNTIDTATGDLILDAATKNVNVQADLDVDESLNVDSSSRLRGEVTVDIGIVPDTDKGAYLGTSTLPFSEAYIGNIKIGQTTDNTIDTTTGNLVINTVGGNVNIQDNVDIDGTLNVDLATTLQTTLQVGTAGSVITTTGIGSVGFGTNNPRRDIEFNNKDVFFNSGAIYDTNENVGFRSEQYQVPRNVLTTVGVDTSGTIIGGRFFDAANLIRLNLDFIANEAVGFITSTDYKNPAFTLSSNDYTSCKDDIKDILKAITYDITRGGNSQSVGAGLSYYNGNTLIHITGTDINGYSIKEASIVAISTAAQLARYVINNTLLPKSYQGVGNSVAQIRDLTLQDDPIVGSNMDLDGCSNVVSAIVVSAGIVTTIIGGGPIAAPRITYPDGKIIWAPAGADSRNIIYVSKYGNDDNNGRTEGAAKLTIGAAAEIAQPGDTIMVRSGVYAENNPIGLRTDVTVSGQDLRLVTIYPQNDDDVFYVRRGCLIENLSFAYSKDPFDDAAPIQITGAAVAFPPPAGIGSARTGFLDPGPATEGPTGRWRSPYIRNCTNFMTGSIGMKIDGNHATAATIGADLKCMVCDSFTQYNENGIGVSITNNGYAQLVSIFTINCDIAIYADTGGSCDLTNSNSSFGNFGLVAVGLGSTEFTGKVSADTNPEVDTVGLTSVFDSLNNVRRPYDGQSLWFKINLDNYPDAVGTGTITAPLNLLRSITVLNGGSGYSQANPPSVLVRDFDGTVAPKGPQGIIAEASATINENGQITAIDVINTGRNYLPTQNIVIDIEGNTGLATAVMEPIYFSVFEATEPLSPTGVSTVTFNEFVPYELFANDPIELRRISRILTSSHSFEYIGSGTDINTATPFKGGIPIKANEVVALDGAQIPFTSTDQKGNFDIGDGIQIDQTTSTIRGRDFSRAIQAEVTPLILALR
jgi:hypothetical protein